MAEDTKRVSPDVDSRSAGLAQAQTHSYIPASAARTSSSVGETENGCPTARRAPLMSLRPLPVATTITRSRGPINPDSRAAITPASDVAPAGSAKTPVARAKCGMAARMASSLTFTYAPPDACTARSALVVLRLAHRNTIRQGICRNRPQRLASAKRLINRGSSLSLDAKKARQAAQNTQLLHLYQALPDACNRAAIANSHCQPIGHIVLKLFTNLQPAGLFAFHQIGVDGAVAIVPAKLSSRIHRQIVRLVVGTAHRKNRRAIHQELCHFCLWRRFRNKNKGTQPHVCSEACQR